MLHRDKLVPHGLRLVLRCFQSLVHIGGDVDLVRLTAGPGDLGEFFDLSSGGGLQTVRVRADGGDQLGNQAVRLFQKGVEQMGLLDLRAAVLPPDLLGGEQRLLGFACIVQVGHMGQPPLYVRITYCRPVRIENDVSKGAGKTRPLIVTELRSAVPR